MEVGLRIVAAGLDAEVAAGALGDKLIADEARQVDQRRGPPRPEPEAIDAIRLEQTGAEPERHGQATWRQIERLAGVGGRHRRIFADRHRPTFGKVRGGVGPGPHQVGQIRALRGHDVEGGEIGVGLDRRDDTVLMLAVERQQPALRDAGRLDQRRMILGADGGRPQRAGGERGSAEKIPSRGRRWRREGTAHRDARISVLTSSMT